VCHDIVILTPFKNNAAIIFWKQFEEPSSLLKDLGSNSSNGIKQ
jgi:hypothetical protein